LKSHLNAEGFAKDAVDVIYNGIEVGPLPDPSMRAQVRHELGMPTDGLVVGTIGRLDPVKDQAMLIRAIDQVASDKQLLLIIIGDGAERQRLEQIVADMKSPSRVRFLGHRDDARRWLAGCDVYVNSSISEGISLTILEAMAAGLATVVTRVGGTPEVVDESCGRFVPPRAPNVLADTLSMLADDSALRRELGQRARQRVETRFTVERMVEQYRTVYESTLLRRN
jgi:glycosyltransferase involved in cell wall biosynthesis